MIRESGIIQRMDIVHKFLGFILVSLFTIRRVFADEDSDLLNGDSGSESSAGETPSIQIPNPLRPDSLPEVLTSVGNYLIGISAVVLTVMILWGAFQLMTSRGVPANITKGRQIITWALIGFFILLIAGGLASIVAGILGGANVDTDVNVEGVNLGGIGGVIGVITTIARWMFAILIGLGIIMVLYSAFLYMFSGGVEAKISSARKTLTYAIVALVVGILAGSVGAIIQSLLQSAAPAT